MRWPAMMRLTCIGILAQFALLLLAFGVLTYCFLISDFSVIYVAQHSYSLLSWELKLGAVWGGHEGSLLLWVLLLSAWSALFAWHYRQQTDPLFPLTLAVLSLMLAALLLFVVLWSDPFVRIFPPAIEGRDLNPMLQHPGGHYIIESLMKTVPASQIVAIVRNPAKAQALAAQGITVRQADYGDEAALTSALQGVEKLLLISSSEVGQRAPQHRNVINAAKAAGVKFIAYTSLLHADTSPLGLADEHIETEKMLADSGIVYTLLRNGWYSENYLASAPAALEHGVFIGAAGDGKIASATRADYAAAAARVISEAGHEGKVYELAGDSAWTLTQLAAELTKQSGKQVTYQNLSEADFAAALKSVGLPDGLADMLADSDVGASKGGLFDNSKTLSKLIGRPTTTLAESVSHLFNVNN